MFSVFSFISKNSLLISNISIFPPIPFYLLTDLKISELLQKLLSNELFLNNYCHCCCIFFRM